MRSLIKLGTGSVLLIGMFFLGSIGVAAQEKHVNVVGIEVDGKPVKARFKVQIVLEDKALKAKTDDKGFFIPAAAAGQSVGVLITFDKYTTTFLFVTPGHFDEDWMVGVDTKPFDPAYLEDADPEKTDVIYYVRFPNSTDKSNRLVTVVGKPTVTIK